MDEKKQMREILFRGQTRRLGELVRMNGEKVPSKWVYGGICQGEGAFSIIYGWKDEEREAPIDKFVVYSDTVGQYTGLTDKNGKKIFEGDICKTQKRSRLFLLNGTEQWQDMFGAKEKKTINIYLILASCLERMTNMK